MNPDRGMRSLLTYCAGALLGGTAGAAVVVVVTTIIKEALAAASGAEPWLLLTLPVIGVALSTFVLHVIGHGDTKSTHCPGRYMSVVTVRQMSNRLLADAGQSIPNPTRTAAATPSRELLVEKRAR